MSDSEWFEHWRIRAEKVARGEMTDKEDLAITFEETLRLFENLIDSLEAPNPEALVKSSFFHGVDKQKIPVVREKIAALRRVCELTAAKFAAEKARGRIATEFND
jgi:hypothetical protein